MPKRSSKRKDVSETAFDIVQRATNPAATSPDAPPSEVPSPAPPEKNPAAVALGRLGGLRGGPARAKTLSKKRRREIARKAARKRWSRGPSSDNQ